MRVCVLDTDVLVAALRSATGASRRILQAARAHEFQLVMSVPLVVEYQSVLTRPEQLAVFEATADEILAILDEIAASAKKVDLSIRTRPTLTDPDDEMVLETAVNGNAEMIVTFNTRHFALAAGRFACRPVRPGELLRILVQDAQAREELR
jgi:putative PIN family toxin of toxin-antitoxin system